MGDSPKPLSPAAPIQFYADESVDVGGGVNAQTRQALNIGFEQGFAYKLMISITAKAGTAITDWDWELLDSSDPAAPLAARNTIDSDIDEPIAGSVPVFVVEVKYPDGEIFKTQSTIAGGSRQLAIDILHNGGDGTTAYTYRVEVLGEAMA